MLYGADAKVFDRPTLKEGQRYVARVRVANTDASTTSVKVYLDDRLSLEWTGNADQLGVKKYLAKPTARQIHFVLSAVTPRATIYGFRLRMSRGQAEFLRPPKKPN